MNNLTKITMLILIMTFSVGAAKLDKIRKKTPRATVFATDYKKLVNCIADDAAARFDMSQRDTEFGASFYYRDTTSYGGAITGAALLVDVYQGSPAKALVFVKGGPWLGRDNSLVNRVVACGDVPPA